MKRKTTLVLAVMMLLFLTGCGSSELKGKWKSVNYESTIEFTGSKIIIPYMGDPGPIKVNYKEKDNTITVSYLGFKSTGTFTKGETLMTIKMENDIFGLSGVYKAVKD